MSPRSQRFALPVVLILLLTCGASAAEREDQIARFKQLQAQILLSEPAEKLEKLERLEAWRKKMKKGRAATKGSAGQRSKPRPSATDLGRALRSRPSGTTLVSEFGAAAAPPNHAVSDPTGEPSGSCQSEVSIAAVGNHLVAAWNDGQGIYPLPEEDTQGYGFSSDGGLTWTDGGRVPNDGNFLWSSDPVVVADEKTGAFYYCGLYDAIGENGIAMVKGEFCGSSFRWGQPRRVSTVPNSSALLDKEWMAVDSLTHNLYVTYSNFVIAGGAPITNSIRLTLSTDDGQTWSNPVTLSASSDAGLVQGSRPAVGPDGELYVVWHAIGTPDDSPYGRDFLRIRKSTDGGQNFGPQVTADSVFSNFSSGAPGFNRGLGITFPGIAVDRSSGPNRGRVYLTWNESLDFYDAPLPAPGSATAQYEIENNNGPFPGQGFAGATPFQPGYILRGLISTTGNPGDLDYWKWNATQGQTVVFYLDSLSANLDAAFRIFCSDGQTLLAFSQNGTGGPGLLVFTAPTTDTYFMRMASYRGLSTGGYRILTALDAPSSDRARDHRDIFVKSSANGTTWGPTVRVNDSPGYFDDWLPEVQVDDQGRVFVADYDWRDAASICGGGSNVYLYESMDQGATWAPGAGVSEVTTNWTTTYSTLLPNHGDYIGLFAGDSTVHVAWADGRRGDPDIFMATPTAATACTASPICLVDTTVALQQITLTWSAPAGFSGPLLRRVGTGPIVDLGPVSEVGGQITYVDTDITPGQVHRYALVAPGYCEDLSGSASVIPLCDQAPVTLAGSTVQSDTVTVTWSAPQGLQATVQRRAGTGPFVDLGIVTADANDRIVFVDEGVARGFDYTYRLQVSGFCQVFVGTVTVSIPGSAFGIELVRPNPADRRRPLFVRPQITGSAPAFIELLDISGRQITRVPVPCPARLFCEVDVLQGISVKPGLYFVRLVEGSREAVKRVSIL